MVIFINFIIQEQLYFPQNVTCIHFRTIIIVMEHFHNGTVEIIHCTHSFIYLDLTKWHRNKVWILQKEAVHLRESAQQWEMISKILEAQPKATIHGVVVGLSPVKDNRTQTRKWFNGEIADESVMHFVSFDSRLWHVMDKSREEGSPIVLKNCSIQKSRCTLNFETLPTTRQKWIHLHGSSS